MILTDRVNTFTMPQSDDKATPIINTSSTVTIGGVVKTQADSQRLRIAVRMRLTQAQVVSLMAIIKNFSAELYYTPQRLLWDKAANTEFRVILANSPQIEERLYNCGVIFHVSLEFEEVI